MTTPASVVDFATSANWNQTSTHTWVLSGYSQNPHREITDLKARLAESERQRQMWEILATTDSLTGLFNRLKLDTLNKDFQADPEQHRVSNPNVSLLFIDLDKFGQFNKVYGDHVGDMVLRKLGEAVNQIIRDNDLAIRKGGDEFVVFLRGSDYMTAYKTVVQRLQKLLTEDFYVEIEGKKIQIKGSIGAFPYDPNLSPLENMQQADASMRQIKAEQRKDAIDYEAPEETPMEQISLPGFDLDTDDLVKQNKVTGTQAEPLKFPGAQPA